MDKSRPLREAIVEQLAPDLGPFIAKQAVDTFARKKLGVSSEELTREHLAALLVALRPVLNTLLGSARAADLLVEIKRVCR